jgi:diguanylate cyclase (GGDEF)-like protein
VNSKLVVIVFLSFLIFTSAGLLTWQHYGMNLSFTVLGKDSDRYNAYPVNDQVNGGASQTWMQQFDDRIVLNCDIVMADYAYPFCEIAVQFSADNNGVDLSIYDHVKLELGYTDSPNDKIRIQIKNSNPIYTTVDDPTSEKFNIVEYNPADEGTQITIALDHFQVPEWWIASYHVPISLSMPEFNNATTIEVSTGYNISPGKHEIWVKEISFTGKRMSYTEIVTFLVVVWVSAAVLMLVVTLVKFQRGHNVNKQRIKELKSINRALDLHSQEMERQAKTDPLTGAMNRAGVSETLLQWQTDARRYGMKFSVIFCDIDYFKNVNDNHGHSVGDAVIVEIASLLRSHTREMDFVVRWGGEEFVLLCPNTSLEASSALAEKLRKTFEVHPWPESLKVTCSFGVGQMKPTENIEQFFKRADEALYIAKEHGRNRVEISE